MNALLPTLALVAALGYPAKAMNVRGERILIFGDSLTQHSSGGNPIWNVDAGSQRSHHAPGDLLASLLLEQGAAAVRTNALVSRSAFNFWTREPAQQLIADDLAWKPTKIVFVLGTNDIGLAAAPDIAAFERLRDAYKPSKAELWAIGPFRSGKPAAGIDAVAATMRKAFGSRFIDGRKLTTLISPGSDGLHYSPASARMLALNMADALISASPVKPWMGIAIGAALVITGGFVYSLISTRKRGLGGAPSEKYLFRPRPNSYPVAFRKEAHGQYEIYQRPNDYMVKYSPKVDDIARIEPSSKVGHFSTITDLDAAIEHHHANRSRGLRGVEILDGKRWGGSQAELVRSGARQVPCKSGLDRGGQARCWTRAGLGNSDDDDPQPGEDDESWFQRITRRADENRRRMHEAMKKSPALFLTTAQGRQILVVQTPEMSNRSEGAVRVTTFDEDGPIGHVTRRSTEQLAEEVQRDWNPKEIRPASEAEVLAWTSTERFARGAARVAEVQRANERRSLKGPMTDSDYVTLSHTISEYKPIARRRKYDQRDKAFASCDIATPEFVRKAAENGVTLESYRFNLTRKEDLAAITRIYGLTKAEAAKLRAQAKDCQFHEIAVAEDGMAIDWTANKFKQLPVPFIFRLRDKPKAIPALAPRVTHLPANRAQIVAAAARAVPSSGRYGADSVFVSEVHRKVQEQGINISLEDFKRELIRMLARSEVILARADLPDAMDGRLVDASEIESLGSQFHFVLLPDARRGRF